MNATTFSVHFLCFTLFSTRCAQDWHKSSFQCEFCDEIKADFFALISFIYFGSLFHFRGPPNNFRKSPFLWLFCFACVKSCVLLSTAHCHRSKRDVVSLLSTQQFSCSHQPSRPLLCACKFNIVDCEFVCFVSCLFSSFFFSRFCSFVFTFVCVWNFLYCLFHTYIFHRSLLNSLGRLLYLHFLLFPLLSFNGWHFGRFAHICFWQ